MMLKKFFNASYDEALISELSGACCLDKKTIGILTSRGYDTKEKIEKFLNPKIEDLIDPFLIDGMQQFIDKLKKAIVERKRILIFGDYDVDGISATAIMIKTIKKMGYNCNYFLPNRFVDGYGMTKDSIDKVKEKYSPDLIITVDCGISCHDEVEYAKSLGIEVVVTDHHEIPEILPDCLILNAKMPNQKYPFQFLCGAGLAFKISCALLGFENCYEMLTIATIATIADIVPLVEENRTIVSVGLTMLEQYLPVGVKALFKNNKLSFSSLTASDISFKVSPRLNSSGRMGEANDSLVLFLEENPSRIKQQIDKINAHNTARQELCNRIYDDCSEMLKSRNLSKEKCIILSNDKWDSGILGIIAARLVDAYNRPAFLFANENGVLKGSGRSIDQINIHEMLVSSSELLETFGGHTMAAGLSLKKENFDSFVKTINKYIEQNINDKIFEPIQYYDIDTTASELSHKFIEELDKLEPYGCGNERPLFNMKIESVTITPLKNFPCHANLVFEKKLNLIHFNYLENLNKLTYSKFPQVVFEVQKSMSKNEIKGIVKSIYSNKELKQNSMEIGDAYYLHQLFNSKEIDSEFQFNYFSNKDLINLVVDCSKTMFGTLFVANNFNTYKKFIDNYETKNITENYIFEVVGSGGNNAIVYAPMNEKSFNNFNKIVFLDMPLDKSFIQSVSKQTSAKLYFPADSKMPKNLFNDLSVDRADFGKVFNALKLSKCYTFANLHKFYQNVKRESKQSFSFSMFYFAINVFEELDIINFKSVDNLMLFTITEKSSPLTNSKLYNTVSFIKNIA